MYLYFNFFLFRVLIFAVDKEIAVRKAIYSVYGKLRTFNILVYYFDNLLNNTTLIDFWLIKNNLEGVKVRNLFVLVLSSFDKAFHLIRRPFHSFFKRFYDILIFLKKIKKKKAAKKFYRVLIKILVFVKKNRLSIRKKSIKGKPLRRGVRISL